MRTLNFRNTCDLLFLDCNSLCPPHSVPTLRLQEVLLHMLSHDFLASPNQTFLGKAMSCAHYSTGAIRFAATTTTTVLWEMGGAPCFAFARVGHSVDLGMLSQGRRPLVQSDQRAPHKV